MLIKKLNLSVTKKSLIYRERGNIERLSFDMRYLIMPLCVQFYFDGHGCFIRFISILF